MISHLQFQLVYARSRRSVMTAESPVGTYVLRQYPKEGRVHVVFTDRFGGDELVAYLAGEGVTWNPLEYPRCVDRAIEAASRHCRRMQSRLGPGLTQPMRMVA